MKKDFALALTLVAVFVVLTASRVQFPTVLDGLLYITRPLATVGLLGAVASLYFCKLEVSALVAGLLSIYLLKTLWTNWPKSDARRLHLEVARDQARFNPDNSIDLQFANGTAKHNLPVLLSRPFFPETLVFPPSAQTQHEMNG